jgi:hypothetical protein
MVNLVPHSRLRKLTGQDYFEIVASWAQNNPKWGITHSNRPILTVLCDFHAELQDMAAYMAGNKDLAHDLTPLRSLHNLWNEVELVLQPPPPRDDLLELNYLNCTVDPDLKKRMSEVAEEVITK